MCLITSVCSKEDLKAVSSTNPRRMPNGSPALSATAVAPIVRYGEKMSSTAAMWSVSSVNDTVAPLTSMSAPVSATLPKTESRAPR